MDHPKSISEPCLNPCRLEEKALDEDSEELEHELEEGDHAAQKMAEHLHAMGADKTERVVTVEGQPYTVTVERGDKRTLK